MDSKEQLEAELAGWKIGRVVTDFCLQAVQRAVVLATVGAAAKITGDPLISIVETATFLLFFAWTIYSGAMASRWIKLQNYDRPSRYRLVAAIAFTVEFVFIAVLWLATGSFAAAMAERFANS
ncbi:hypothetical protein [uncultured Brevundimonas sp.]|uniref:hypothetical protein n=1 Tax=uncultured Brevundimonas sp. TaxID=213418 RepID=UPI0025DCBAAE|nr:hypothetical protein [uncultured Brevundimonas sp.]